MNNTAKLVIAWANFEETHAKASLEDFCRYYLATDRYQTTSADDLFEGELPPRPDIVITKLLDRISRMHMVYIQLAMQGMPINHFEDPAENGSNLPYHQRTFNRTEFACRHEEEGIHYGAR